ncbi:MAG: hypothetical protein HC878_06480 [Leptolyngbyaceae cyanobacterium SL_5_14]|nr:hypothetical protein [Leptolyngbyaceae cyanobacterium SL_5_14]
MNRSKIVAVITGAIALLLGIAYLVLVQLLDFRGEMLPAPVDLSQVEEFEAALVQPTSSSSTFLPWEEA